MRYHGELTCAAFLEHSLGISYGRCVNTFTIMRSHNQWVKKCFQAKLVMLPHTSELTIPRFLHSTFPNPQAPITVCLLSVRAPSPPSPDTTDQFKISRFTRLSMPLCAVAAETQSPGRLISSVIYDRVPPQPSINICVDMWSGLTNPLTTHSLTFSLHSPTDTRTLALSCVHYFPAL